MASAFHFTRAFSQDELIGVKWKWNAGCFALPLPVGFGLVRGAVSGTQVHHHRTRREGASLSSLALQAHVGGDVNLYA